MNSGSASGSPIQRLQLRARGAQQEQGSLMKERIARHASIHRQSWRLDPNWKFVSLSNSHNGAGQALFKHRDTGKRGFTDIDLLHPDLPSSNRNDAEWRDEIEPCDSSTKALITLDDPFCDTGIARNRGICARNFRRCRTTRSILVYCDLNMNVSTNRLFDKLPNRIPGIVMRHRKTRCRRQRGTGKVGTKSKVVKLLAGRTEFTGSVDPANMRLRAAFESETFKEEDVRLAVAYGAQIPNSLLHYTLVQGGTTEVVDLLLELGADPNTRENGLPPLHVCLLVSDRPEMIRTLIRGGADTRLKWEGPVGGDRPVVIAVAFGRKDSLEVLLSAGGSLFDRDGDGRSLLQVAITQGQIETARVLLKHGVNVDERVLDPTTPLVWAIVYAQLQMAEFILQEGADLSVLSDFQFYKRSTDTGAEVACLYVGNEHRRQPASKIKTRPAGAPEHWEDWQPVTVCERQGLAPSRSSLKVQGLALAGAPRWRIDVGAFNFLSEKRSQGQFKAWYRDPSTTMPWHNFPGAG